VFFRDTAAARPLAAAETFRRQLGGFESTDDRGITYRIVVDDYDRLPLDQGPCRVAPGYAWYRDGLFVNHGERLAFQTSNETLYVWAERRSPVTVTYLLQILLLPLGMTFVHAAGVSVRGKGLLFPALGGIGKTALIAHLLDRPEARLLGDDYVLVAEDGMLRGFQAPFSLYPYHRDVFPAFFRASGLRILPGSLPFRAARRILDALGIWRLLEGKVPVEYGVIPAPLLYASDRLETSPVPVHAVYVMQRVRGLAAMQVRPASIEEISTFAGNVLLYEWHPLARMLAAQLTLSGTAVSDYLRRVQEVVARGLGGAARLRVIELPQELTPAEVGPAVAGVSLADV
jgi:hypothetical protein